MIAAVKGWFAVLSALLFILPQTRRLRTISAGRRVKWRERRRHSPDAARRSRSPGATFPRCNASDLSQARAVSRRRLRDAGAPSGGERRRGRGADHVERKPIAVSAGGGSAQRRGAADLHCLLEAPVPPAPPIRAPPSRSIASSCGSRPTRSWTSRSRRRRCWCSRRRSLRSIRGATGRSKSGSRIALRRRGPGRAIPVRACASPERVSAFLPGDALYRRDRTRAHLECHASDEPWTLDSGSRAVLLAAFAAGRNYFDGRRGDAESARARRCRRSIPRAQSRTRAGSTGCLAWWMAARRF